MGTALEKPDIRPSICYSALPSVRPSIHPKHSGPSTNPSLAHSRRPSDSEPSAVLLRLHRVFVLSCPSRARTTITARCKRQTLSVYHHRACECIHLLSPSEGDKHVGVTHRACAPPPLPPAVCLCQNGSYNNHLICTLSPPLPRRQGQLESNPGVASKVAQS